MTFFDAFDKIKSSIHFDTVDTIDGHLAIQLNITDEDAAKYGNDLSRYSQDEIHITLKPEYYGMEITKEVLGFENVKIIYDPTKNPNINVNSTKEYTIQIALEVDGTEMVQAAVIHCRSLEFVKDAWIPCFVLIPA